MLPTIDEIAAAYHSQAVETGGCRPDYYGPLIEEMAAAKLQINGNVRRFSDAIWEIIWRDRKQPAVTAAVYCMLLFRIELGICIGEARAAARASATVQ